ncbi:gene transfer agent family protein [Methylocapsa aurea]|uniref:gene transfer agent family protein n=1 Tax=Methylocapsa aurea TaxID=663610 RepID=UPI0005698B46|nr:gene transfer agent family protein [Methylocapsa aurea]
MTTDTRLTAFFGDLEHDFQITPALIPELERVTESGIGSLCRRLFNGDFRHADMIETIRLGLIGGGANPQQASLLVKAYALNRPLDETLPLAIDILSVLWFGNGNKTNENLDEQA